MKQSAKYMCKYDEKQYADDSQKQNYKWIAKSSYSRN